MKRLDFIRYLSNRKLYVHWENGERGTIIANDSNITVGKFTCDIPWVLGGNGQAPDNFHITMFTREEGQALINFIVILLLLCCALFFVALILDPAIVRELTKLYTLIVSLI